MQTNHAKRIFISGLLLMLIQTAILANSGGVSDLKTSKEQTSTRHDTTIFDINLNFRDKINVQYFTIQIPNLEIQNLINARVRENAFKQFKSKKNCDKIHDEMAKEVDKYVYDCSVNSTTRFELKSVSAVIVSCVHDLLTVEYEFLFNAYGHYCSTEDTHLSKIYYYDLITGNEYTADEIFPSIYKDKISWMIEDRADDILTETGLRGYPNYPWNRLRIYKEEGEEQAQPLINFCKILPYEGFLLVDFPLYCIEYFSRDRYSRFPTIYFRYDELKPYISPLGPLAFLRDEKPDTLLPMMKNLNRPIVMPFGSEWSRILSIAKADSIYIKRRIKNIMVKTGLTNQELTTLDSINIRYHEKKWMVTYNEKGLLQQLDVFNIKDSLLNTTLYTYDEHDNLTKVEKIRERKLYQYDGRNNLLSYKRFQSDLKEMYQVDYFYASNYYIEGTTRKYCLNEKGQLSKILNSDALGRLNHVYTNYVYDTQNRLVNCYDDYNSYQLVYDAKGKLITKLRGHNAEVDERETEQYLYDKEGRLTTQIERGGTWNEEFKYNSEGEIAYFKLINAAEMQYVSGFNTDYEVTYQYFDKDKK